jgi:hypothetical protein
LKHLDTLEESYLQHAKEGSRISARLFLASIACLIHSIVPNLFKETASSIMSSELQRVKDRLPNKAHIQIRYNTKAGQSGLYWRIIIDGKESLASQVVVNGAMYGEESRTKEGQKLNLACDGTVRWVDTRAIIEA